MTRSLSQMDRCICGLMKTPPHDSESPVSREINTFAPVNRLFDALQRQGATPKRTARGFQAKCPCHEDRKPSLSVSTGAGGRALVHCHAGCDTGNVLACIDMSMADLFPDKDGTLASSKVAEPRTTYCYVNELGEPLFEMRRFDDADGKRMRAGHWSGDRFVWNVQGCRRVLYRLPELRESDADQWVFTTEGEKAVEALRDHELVATCNPFGAGKWREEYSRDLAGRHVVILPDNDDAGRKHAEAVYGSVAPVAASVRIVTLPRLPVGGDVADFLNADEPVGSVDKLLRVVSETPPMVGGGPSWLEELKEVCGVSEVGDAGVAPDTTGTSDSEVYVEQRQSFASELKDESLSARATALDLATPFSCLPPDFAKRVKIAYEASRSEIEEAPPYRRLWAIGRRCRAIVETYLDDPDDQADAIIPVICSWSRDDRPWATWFKLELSDEDAREMLVDALFKSFAAPGEEVLSRLVAEVDSEPLPSYVTRGQEQFKRFLAVCERRQALTPGEPIPVHLESFATALFGSTSSRGSISKYLKRAVREGWATMSSPAVWRKKGEPNRSAEYVFTFAGRSSPHLACRAA